MKIALFASAFHPSLGGVEEVTRQLAHALRRAGHEPIIVTQRWPRDLPAFEEFEGLPVHRFAFRVPAPLPNPWLRLRNRALWRLSAPGTHRAIIALLEREGVEIINIHCVSANAVYAGAAARALQLPLATTLHGELTMDADQIFQNESGARAIMREALQEAHALSACSGQTLREAEAFYGAPFGARARTIYSGIRLADFENAVPYAHPRPYILGIGRQVAQKGFDVLLRAHAAGRAQALEQGRSWPDLLLAGEGEAGGELRALARELDAGEGVEFLGRVDRAGAVALFAGCEFFVLPSRHEPMGIVNLEAMAAGRAVVASRVGGVPELIGHEENGLLVAPDDVPALTQALTRLAGDVALRARLGQNGAQRVRAFDWDAIAAQYLDLYRAAQHSHAQRQTRAAQQTHADRAPKPRS